jgi:hypothetical protein
MGTEKEQADLLARRRQERDGLVQQLALLAAHTDGEPGPAIGTRTGQQDDTRATTDRVMERLSVLNREIEQLDRDG